MYCIHWQMMNNYLNFSSIEWHANFFVSFRIVSYLFVPFWVIHAILVTHHLNKNREEEKKMNNNNKPAKQTNVLHRTSCSYEHLNLPPSPRTKTLTEFKAEKMKRKEMERKGKQREWRWENYCGFITISAQYMNDIDDFCRSIVIWSKLMLYLQDVR